MPATPFSDTLSRVLLDQAGVRAVHVQLESQWQELLSQAASAYPGAVRDILGEACVATLLVSAQIKFDGRLMLQLNAEAPLRTLFAECTRQGTFRGIARFSEPVPERLDLRQQGDSSLLAVTIEGIPGSIAASGRYQGLVPLDSPDLAAALESYFGRSEQLPTRMLLACNEQRAAGLLIQQLPEGDADSDSDAWPRVQALFETLERDELLSTDGETLLFRLFHEESPRLLDQQPVAFACTCSAERVSATLHSLGESEALAAVGEDDFAHIDCQFCGKHYALDRIQIAQLFHGDLPATEAPTDTRH